MNQDMEKKENMISEEELDQVSGGAGGFTNLMMTGDTQANLVRPVLNSNNQPQLILLNQGGKNGTGTISVKPGPHPLTAGGEEETTLDVKPNPPFPYNGAVLRC